jgi:uncharacterized protein YukE
MNEQVYVDPEKLQEFSIQLRGFAGATDRAVDRLTAALSGLGRSWEDPAFEQFQSHVRGLAQTLLVFVGEADKFSSYLGTKADEAKRIHHGSIPGG